MTHSRIAVLADASRSTRFAPSALVLGISMAFGPASLVSAQAPVELEKVEVTAKPEPAPYQSESLSSAKYTQPLVETPQTITVLTEALLEDQGTKTLRDALRNVTGISMQAGEGNPPTGDALKIRGFSAREDILVDNLRDIGVYYRDPFNVEQIEIAKGPSSGFAGRGSTGGTVNLVSKTPGLVAKREIEAGIGSDSLYRITADLNQPLESLTGSALRLNVLYHDADQPGRDLVNNSRFGIAPSFVMGLGTPTRLTFTGLYTEQDNLTDAGLPNARNRSLQGSGFEGRVAPVDDENFYGYTTDVQDIQAVQAGLKLEHDFNPAASLRSQLRYGYTHNDSIFSSPRFVGNVTTLDATTQSVGNQKPRDQTTDVVTATTDLTLRFDTAGLKHTLVSGAEYVREGTINQRRLDANGPATNLFNPVAQAAAPIAYNGTSAALDTDTLAAYLQNNIAFSPQWEANVGVRHDFVTTEVTASNDGRVPTYSQNIQRDDREFSGNFSLVYKPVDSASIYAGVGSSFNPSGAAEVVQLAGGNNNLPVTPDAFDVDPERNLSYELGSKWNVLNKSLLLQAALFRTERTNARTNGVDPGDPAIVLDGEQRVQGVELSATGRISSRVNLFVGYTYQDGKVTKSNNAVEQGQRLDNTPKHSASGWLTVQALPKLTLGGGAQYVSSRTSNLGSSNTAGNLVITDGSRTLFDAVAAYEVSPQLTLRLNGYNLTDKDYIFELASGQSIPGAARSAVMSAIYSF